MANKGYACVHVASEVRPVLLVVHEEGDWVLACGGDDHEQSADYWLVVHVDHFLDETMADVLVDLGNGQQAERATVDAPWVRAPLETME